MILDKIVACKRGEVDQRKIERPVSGLLKEIEICARPRSLAAALKSGTGINIIAEIKKASPSAGMIAGQIDPERVAIEYEMGGAAAISVLTDKVFFAGDINFLPLVRRSVSIPVLRKDFIIDPYQIYEARAFGADAVLLIAAILSQNEMKTFLDLVRELDMEALVEVHDEPELQQVLEAGAEIIGINNRNLKTFEVSLETTFALLGKIPEGKIVVSESGIKDRFDLGRLAKAGVRAVLVGEALMRASDRSQAVRELLGGNDSYKGLRYN